MELKDKIEMFWFQHVIKGSVYNSLTSLDNFLFSLFHDPEEVIPSLLALLANMSKFTFLYEVYKSGKIKNWKLKA
ncbi:MAG: hypothetical protein DRI44_02560 [Chlamydiae bacterium]|nr:MAG: hypothetical protein DRI44_02560 [Chlamydiota bacterium]